MFPAIRVNPAGFITSASGSMAKATKAPPIAAGRAPVIVYSKAAEHCPPNITVATREHRSARFPFEGIIFTDKAGLIVCSRFISLIVGQNCKRLEDKTVRFLLDKAELVEGPQPSEDEDTFAKTGDEPERQGSAEAEAENTTEGRGKREIESAADCDGEADTGTKTEGGVDGRVESENNPETGS